MSGPDTEREIEVRIAEFTDELVELIRSATVDAVQKALSSQLNYALGTGRGRHALRRPRNGHPGISSLAGGKRTSEELEALQTQLLSYIGKHAGERIEQIAVGMDVSTKELSLPVKKLLAAGQLRTEGQKRATQYFPA